jgi:(S)-2-hydroxyglutarate dehydrogenase
MNTRRDLVIIGGGIVGLATGYQFLQRNPGRNVAILEKESQLAQHQTGHNSGVMHSGIYYKPGSLKALNCRAGKKAMEEFAREEGIPYELCGKVIVATSESELPRMQALYERGLANGVQCKVIDQAALRDLEPHCAGIRALHVPEAGIIDYPAVCNRLAEKIQAAGGTLVLSARVAGLVENPGEVVAQSSAGEFHAQQVVNCAGLHSDRITALAGGQSSAKIIPFRGEYYEVKPTAEHLCQNLIYPVPDPQFPFLGVHFTRMIRGGVECGPNAVLAFAREGYRKRDLNLRDLAEMLGYPGFRKLMARHWRMGLEEMWRSFSKGAFLRALQRLIPEIRSRDLEPAPAGIRAQAVSITGGLVDDFAFHESKRILHVINSPSPAATASLAIGKAIVEKLEQRANELSR